MPIPTARPRPGSVGAMTEEPIHESPEEFVEDFAEEHADEPGDAFDTESQDRPDEPGEPAAGSTDGTESTGHPAVDEVLRSLDAIGDAPVDEHVAVFEQAHDQLRRTLSGAGDE